MDLEVWCNISFEGSLSNPLGYAHHLFLNGAEIKDLVIPNSVTSIGDYAFSGCTGLTSITIGNNVTNIGNNAFSDCTSLTSISIGNNVTSLGNSAFYGCSNLNSITIPNSVTSIGEQVFANCSGLTSITLPNSVTIIGEYAFFDCSSLSSITIPNSVTSIGNSAFTWCTSLTSITIPNSVTSIGESAFLGCRQAKNIILPESLQIIRKLTFSNCSSLTDITIPAAVEYIYQEAFFGCSSLTEIKALPTAPPFAYGNTFSNYSATLKVPEEGKDAYSAHDVWSKFEKIQTLTGEDVNPEKCATPTIKYIGGKLLFECETEGVEFVYSITTPANTTNQTGNNIDIPHTIKVSVYAKKAGHLDSDVVTEDVDVRGLKGDVNTDGEVNVGDIVTVTNIMAGKD